jgi:hypothetical protein
MESADYEVVEKNSVYETLSAYNIMPLIKHGFCELRNRGHNIVLLF